MSNDYISVVYESPVPLSKNTAQSLILEFHQTDGKIFQSFADKSRIKELNLKLEFHFPSEMTDYGVFSLEGRSDWCKVCRPKINETIVLRPPNRIALVKVSFESALYQLLLDHKDDYVVDVLRFDSAHIVDPHYLSSQGFSLQMIGDQGYVIIQLPFAKKGQHIFRIVSLSNGRVLFEKRVDFKGEEIGSFDLEPKRIIAEFTDADRYYGIFGRFSTMRGVVIWTGRSVKDGVEKILVE